MFRRSKIFFQINIPNIKIFQSMSKIRMISDISSLGLKLNWNFKFTSLIKKSIEGRFTISKYFQPYLSLYVILSFLVWILKFYPFCFAIFLIHSLNNRELSVEMLKIWIYSWLHKLSRKYTSSLKLHKFTILHRLRNIVVVNMMYSI